MLWRGAVEILETLKEVLHTAARGRAPRRDHAAVGNAEHLGRQTGGGVNGLGHADHVPLDHVAAELPREGAIGPGVLAPDP